MSSSEHFVRLTDHAKQRALQRFWINAERLREMAERAVTGGYSIADAPNAKIRRYLRRKAQGSKIYVWGGYIFIFNEQMVLITTYRMPGHLLRSLPTVDTYIGGGSNG